jgi:hypothetical protein
MPTGVFMLLTPLAIIIGVAIGLARGGNLKAPFGAPVRVWPVIAVGVVLQTFAEQWSATPARLSVLIVGSFLLVVASLLNAHIKGAIIAGIGITLNLMAVVANGHIPLRFDALATVNDNVDLDTDPSLIQLNELWKLEDGDTNLAAFGDIVPVPFFDEVVSFGDLILVGGLVVLAMNLVLHVRRVGIGVDDLFGAEKEPVDLREIIDLATNPVTLDEAADLPAVAGSVRLGSIAELDEIDEGLVSMQPVVADTDQPNPS